MLDQNSAENYSSRMVVLVVDDEAGVEIIFSKILVERNVECRFASNAEDALALVRSGKVQPQMVFLDIRLPGMDGVSALPRLLEACPSARVLMMTAYQTVESVITAIKHGAVDYLVKPLNPEMIGRALDQYGVVKSQAYGVAKEAAARADDQEHIPFVIATPMMQKVLDISSKFAASDGAILILGESGTGKERLARYIHENSPRKGRSFVVVDSGSIPESLFESEFFGHERGAFTGADHAKMGRVEEANNGTLFLDEIGNVPISMQAKLLRFIEDKTFVRLGGKDPIHLNIRLVAATNENLEKAIANGTFRQDLYFRLSALTVHLPSLRNRPDQEKHYLVDYFLVRFSHRLKRPLLRLSEEALQLIQSYPWPGNVRELENALFSACLLATEEEIGVEHFPIGVQSYASNRQNNAWVSEESDDQSLRTILGKVEKEHISNILKQTSGNKKRAAEILGMDYKTLLSKLKKYGLDIEK